jgi:hypothetical protein
MTIDVEKLAREAGGTKERDEVFGPHYVMGVDSLERFAGLVLEAAALELDAMAFAAAGKGRLNTAAGFDRSRNAIRAMKPGVKP